MVVSMSSCHPKPPDPTTSRGYNNRPALALTPDSKSRDSPITKVPQCLATTSVEAPLCPALNPPQNRPPQKRSPYYYIPSHFAAWSGQGLQISFDFTAAWAGRHGGDTTTEHTLESSSSSSSPGDDLLNPVHEVHHPPDAHLIGHEGGNTRGFDMADGGEKRLVPIRRMRSHLWRIEGNVIMRHRPMTECGIRILHA
jgi:hypothetical protein